MARTATKGRGVACEHRAAALVTAFVLSLASAPTPGARAFDEATSCPNDTAYDKYAYDFLAPGTAGGVSLADQAVIKTAWDQTWMSARSYLGGDAISLDNYNTTYEGTKFRVFADRAPAAGAYTTLACNEIHLHTSANAGGNEALAREAAHELGHVLNLDHADRDGSFVGQYTWGDIPLMYCEALPSAYGSDDEAAFLYKQDREGLTPASVTANMGFESNASATPGMRWWSKTGGSIGITTNGSRPANHGNRYATFTNSATSQIMYQATNVIPPANTAKAINAAASYRPHEAGSVGFMGFDFLYREVDYQGGNDFCDWELRWTHTPIRDTFGAWIQPTQRQHCTVVGKTNVQWTSCLAPTWTMPSSRSYEAVDLMVRVFSNVTDSAGNLNGVEVDDVRMRL